MPAPTYAPDLYERLGLERSSDARLLRRQYRLLARLYHPDVNRSSESAQRFRELQEAYEVLGDEARRGEYDGWLAQVLQRPQPLTLGVQFFPGTLGRAAGTQRLYALLDVTVQEEGATPAAPLNVVLVLDRSSSMKGRRLHYVREAARRILDQLDPADRFGIVTFNDRASVLLPSGVGSDRGVAHTALDSIAPAGGTELASGLRLGVQEALRFHTPGTTSHVIVLTDGRTYGDEAVALDIAQRGAAAGVGITAMGLGTDWNDEFLDALAQQSAGHAHFVAEPNQAVELFQAQLQRLQRTVARDARLALTLEPGVTLLQAHEVAPSVRPLPQQGDGLALGALVAQPTLRLLLEFQIELPDRDVALLGQLRLQAQVLQDGQLYRTDRLLVMDVGAATTEPAPEAFYQAARHVATLRLQERTWAAVDQGEVSEAASALEQLAHRFLELGATELAQATERERAFLQETGTLSDNGRKVIKYGTRMLALPAPS